MCFGTFDLMHPGHVHFLTRAARHGDELYVVLARDERRAALTGMKPIHTVRERAAMIGALRVVTRALVGHATDMLWHVKRIRPRTIVLGHDQKTGVAELTAWLAQHAPHTRMVRLTAFHRSRYTTSGIKRRLCRNA